MKQADICARLPTLVSTRWGIVRTERLRCTFITGKDIAFREAAHTRGNIRLIAEGGQLSVTISASSSVSKPNESIEDVVKRANALLYQSKEGGRNRCSIESAD